MMDFNVIFSNVSSNSETNSTECDTETKSHPFLTHLVLLCLPLGVLLVIVPALTVIIIVLKNRKLRRESSKIFYVNLLITDVMATLIRWIISSTIIICYLLDVPNVNCNIVTMPLIGSMFATRLMFLPVVIDRFLHIACRFSYKRMFTAKRIAVIINSLWLLSLVVGRLGLIGEEYTVRPESGVCAPQLHSLYSRLFGLVILGMLN